MRGSNALEVNLLAFKSRAEKTVLNIEPKATGIISCAEPGSDGTYSLPPAFDQNALCLQTM